MFVMAVISTSSLTFPKDDTPTCPVELAITWGGLVAFPSSAKLVSEHRIPALGLLLRSLVLEHIPVLDQNSVLDS